MAKTTQINQKKAKNQISSLDFLQVAEVRDGVLILKEGQIRSIVSISSANFALKSAKEQDTLIGAFQGVLNSLEGPIQILVQSRKLDLTNYIEKLKKLEETQTNDLLKVKMQEYIIYIQQMIQQINIMSKQFYVIIGYEPVSLKNDLFGRFMRNINPTSYIRENEDKFRSHKQILMSRTDQLINKLGSLELKMEILNTDQIIALMYNSYNPDTIESIRLTDVGAIDLEDYSANEKLIRQAE